ncbi:MAG: potassium-transporting ATPase subunit KdpA [Candidatus Eisenbacteria bacterium]
MSGQDWLEFAVYFVVLIGLARPLGGYMARLYSGQSIGALGRWLAPLERLTYRLAGVDPEEAQDWRGYARGFVFFAALSFVFVYLVQRLQAVLPLNPGTLGAVSPDGAFNTAVSFVTNTNWQSYGGETTMSDLTQMVALTVQNFLSAAVGMAAMVALIRGLTLRDSPTLGNFWVDLTRGTIYLLLPLSCLLALLLVAQGVPQTLGGPVTANLMHPVVSADGTAMTTQTLARGPVASQLAIKQLGTNGGGFFNVNSAHPYENPTPLSNFLELISILLIPTACCFCFGRMVGRRSEGRVLLAAMLVVFVPLLVLCAWQEAHGPSLLHLPGIAYAGNLEGKEVRFGVGNSALWAAATTAASNGSVNAMHDSMTPLGGLAALWLMQLGEVIFGGVGSGLYGLVLFALIAVFVGGLMVGRTPEYLGKKIEAFDIKMASIAILVPAAFVLVGTSIAVASSAGRAGMLNPGPHGFSEVLYAFSSAANNNGSAFAGLSANTPFYNVLLGVAMLFGRYGVALPVLALAGSLAAKKRVPTGSGTLPTDGVLFVALLVGSVLLVGALTFLPSLALGPIVEHLKLAR